jgi:hypothetical protein
MENPEINQLLNEWRVDRSLPPNFDSAVWRRIEKAQPFSIGAWISEWFGDFLAKPAVAVSYVAIALGLGLAAGQVHSARDLQNAELDAKSSYIRAVDPYSNPMAR